MTELSDSLCGSFQSSKLFLINVTDHSKQTINHHKLDLDKIIRGKYPCLGKHKNYLFLNTYPWQYKVFLL